MASRFRAGCVLAALDPANINWEPVFDDIADHHVTENPLLAGRWAELFAPLGKRLVQPLVRVFRDSKRSEPERFLAASLLTDYANDRTELLVELLTESGPREFAILLVALRKDRDRAVDLLRQEVNREGCAKWKDAPLNPAWQPVSHDTRALLEQAEGCLRSVSLSARRYRGIHLTASMNGFAQADTTWSDFGHTQLGTRFM